MGEPERTGDEPGQSRVELESRLRARELHLQELHEELARLRLEADEQRSARLAAEERVRSLEQRASVLDKRVRYYQREERSRGGASGRESRGARRMERSLERRQTEKERLQQKLYEREEELSGLRSRRRIISARRDDALERAMRRVRQLEREMRGEENGR